MGNIILLSKKDNFSQYAIHIAKSAFGEKISIHSGKREDRFPSEIFESPANILLSFLSPWVIPKKIIDRYDICLNWHPGSSEYPGIGCYNFALYEEARYYGATCHFMAEKVDSGSIVEERRFPVFANDTVETLKLRTMVTMLSMFHDQVCRLAAGDMPQASGQSWTRRAFTRRELEALACIDISMDEVEIHRRVRATTYPGFPGATINIGGTLFKHPIPDRPAII